MADRQRIAFFGYCVPLNALAMPNNKRLFDVDPGPFWHEGAKPESTTICYHLRARGILLDETVRVPIVKSSTSHIFLLWK